jgi:ferric-dicitrate binding protein FerR (iron transport regulator)
VTAHIAPHRWADAWAGRVDDAERETMERHAEACPKCARARERITRASDSFVAIRNQSSPEISWDAVRARVHWSVSTERMSKVRLRSPKLGWIAFGVTAAAGVVAVLAPSAGHQQVATAPAGSDAGVTAPDHRLPMPPAAPAQLVGLVNRATGDVMIDGIRPADLFTRRLAAGTVIATADGRVDVQFGEASAFGLGAHTKLQLRRFDAKEIELVVDGTVDIQVASRQPGQHFVVIAGDRTIEVRGTQFRVHHEGATTEVACRHGLVAVHDARGKLEVGAFKRVEIAADHHVADEHVTPLSPDDVNALAAATPMTLPLWDLDALTHGSAPLEIATAGHREVRLDGVELGAAPLRVRVMPGRHTVEAADTAGRYRRAGWIDVAAPSAGGRPARLEVQPEPIPTRGVDQRRRELHAGIDKARLALCMRRITKAELINTFLQIEISVDAQGAVGYLNVLDTDLPNASRDCVREVLRDVRFKPGLAAVWRERIDPSN